MSLTSASLEIPEIEPTISLSEIITALSFALDLTEGAVPGHSLRSCLLGMRIATEAGLSSTQTGCLYYALLLKDVGCSSNSGRMCQIVGGDDIAVKAAAKLEDWTKPHKASRSMLSSLWKNALPGAGPLERVLRIAKMGLTQHANNKELITLRCDRGASIVRKLGLGELAAEGVRCLDEHWDGSGYPSSAKGKNIPILARICAVAQHLDAFSHERGIEAALDTLRERSGTWFDPDLVRTTLSLHRRNALWHNTRPGDDVDLTRKAVEDLDAGLDRQLPADRLDTICEAFSEVVDAKSHFTYRHSIGVATAAQQIALQLGLSPFRVQLVRRAALLHDTGKLGVSNSILDKPGALTPAERALIEIHPGKSREILQQVKAFHELAVIAGEHHERLDGTGYPDRLIAQDICIESRIISVADFYGALSEERPYRVALDLDKIKSIMTPHAPTTIDPDCYDAVLAALGTSALPSTAPPATVDDLVPACAPRWPTLPPRQPAAV
jgi:putative nucleotidyltransferase with HDIG domain